MAAKRKAGKTRAGARERTTRHRYGDKAMRRLAWLMEHAESEQAQVAAARELLDRVAGGAAGLAETRPGLDDVVDRLCAIRAGKPDG